MKKVKRRSDCPISFALDIFGDKWSLLIIRDLMFKQKQTFGEMMKSEEKISTNILADRLATLECAGLLIGEADEENKTRKIYRLTDKAIDLLPAIIEIVKWSAKYDIQTAAPKEFVERATNDRENMIIELTAILKQLNK